VVLVDFLRANADIFAWSPSDIPGIPREVAEHSPDILPNSRAVQQWLQRFDEEQRQAIGVELRKLLEARFIKEVFHPSWLANHVLVKKKNGKWRMCVHFTSLNKACPKVPFPLPRIDQIVDSTAGFELLCFLDAYSGYHQIKMKESDQLATSFITLFGMFCYVTMSFGLRNAGATYQSTHEVARWRDEATFMVLDEADHIAERRVGLPIRRQRNDPRWRLPLHIRRQLAAIHKLVQGEIHHR
jgi:hypothetical protein